MQPKKSEETKCWYCGQVKAEGDSVYEIRVKNKKNGKNSYFKIPCCKYCHERIKLKIKYTLLKYLLISLILGLILFMVINGFRNWGETKEIIYGIWGCGIVVGWILFIPCIMEHEKAIEFDKISDKKERKDFSSEGREVKPY